MESCGDTCEGLVRKTKGKRQVYCGHSQGQLNIPVNAGLPLPTVQTLSGPLGVPVSTNINLGVPGRFSLWFGPSQRRLLGFLDSPFGAKGQWRLGNVWSLLFCGLRPQRLHQGALCRSKHARGITRWSPLSQADQGSGDKPRPQKAFPLWQQAGKYRYTHSLSF